MTDVIMDVDDGFSNLNDTDCNKEINEDDKEYENKFKSLPNPDGDEDDDGTTCPVCLDRWTNCGEHRICSLKCGHLFGHKCILRWLDTESKKTCPTCKKSVKRSDIRFIYAKKLIAIDNVELENMRLQLEKNISEKNNAMQMVTKYISRENVLLAEIEHLKMKIDSLAGVHNKVRSQNNISKVRLYMEKNIEVCKVNGCRDCRVFDILVPQDQTIISARSPTDLFRGFGLKILSFTTCKSIKFLSLHQEPIKDMSINSTGDKVLTVSSDKKFKVTDIQSSHTLFTNTLNSALWSCTWNRKNNSEQFYVGTQNGIINIYDIRKMPEPLATLSIPGDYSPVVGLASVKNLSKSDSLIVAKLNSVWVFESDPDCSYSRHLLPLEGPFLSLRYDEEIDHILLSSRPNSQFPYTRHTFCYLQKISEPYRISTQIVHTFKGGNTAKLLAKTSCFLSGGLVAGHHESRKSILFYSVKTGEEVGSCPTHDNFVLDMKGIETSNGKFLAYLNEKKLEILKFVVS